MTEKVDKVLVTVAEAAEMLSVSTKVIYNLCAAGEFTKRYVGTGRRNFRIPVAELHEYVASLPTEPRRPA